MVVWHLEHLKWLPIPCDEKILDKSNLYCVKSENETLIKQNISLLKKDLTKYISQLHVYFCKDSTMISSTYLCDASVDCSDGEDTLCDNVQDRPLMDDENLCNLSNVYCPKMCTCILYGMACSNLSKIPVSISDYPANFISIKSSLSFALSRTLLK